LTTPTIQQLKKEKGYHARTNSNISFDEWSFGGQTSSAKQRHHKRVHSWTEKNNKTLLDESSAVVGRRSHDSNSRGTVVVGIHNQFHPPNSETPPHGKAYIKVMSGCVILGG
jgi:hypothetical protein